jgi:uncharacterized protein (TIGR00369 family)
MTAELQNLLNEVAFTRNLGLVVLSAGNGECVLQAPFRKEFERPGGIVSGQVFMAVADVALWLAIKTRLGLADGSVTLEMKTNFLRAAREEDFECRAKVLQLGRRIIYGVAECVSAGGAILAYHTITYIRADS